MPKLPTVTAEKLILVLKKIDFEIVRQRGSHVRMKHPNGRVVTIPVHSGQDLGKGLLRKILRDAELSRENFINLLG
ncbi:type II toxin-antitoxin system HicA family toxin [Acaryochloris thomasi]|uniref:type II toxin-antitoxin system HicA family toxin n=1 Tax=Acaryochloris thomasi TaxID=2929456 RepID=UPI000DA66CE5|nr:type II toxin-antitoxin system HicA family toxin [Acaryochloris thomasi]